MRRRLKQTVIRSVALSVFAASAMTGLGGTGASAAGPVPRVLITEMVPDSANVSSNDAFEYVELYNATDETIDLLGFRLTGKAGSSAWAGTINESFRIPPREAALVWTQNSTISGLTPNLTRDRFRSNYGLTSGDLPDERIYIMQNVSGLYNGSSTQTNIAITLVDPAGADIAKATYYLGADKDDTFENKGILFHQPTDGLNMVHAGGNITATPGRVVAGQMPGTAPEDAVTAGGDRSLTLSWTPVADANAAGYRIYSRDGLPTVTVSDAAHTYTGLANGAEYTFTLSTVYSDGSVSSASLPVKGRAGVPVAPSQVTGLQALPRDGAIVLKWDASPEGDVIGYRVYVDGVRLPDLATGQVHEVQNLVNGQAASIAVYAVNQSGLQSAQPAVVSAKPQAAPAIVVTEIAPNTKNVDYKTGGTDAFEFIELHNTTGSPIQLKGFTLRYIAGSTLYDYPINDSKWIEPDGTFIIWFKNTNVQQVGLSEFNFAYGSAITEDQLYVFVNSGMSNTAPRGVRLIGPDGKAITEAAYAVADIGESISANFIPDRSNGVVSTERFSMQANPGYIYPVQRVADPADTVPPAAPGGVKVVAGVGGVLVTWSEALESDVAYVNVYVDGTVRKKLMMPETSVAIEGLDNGAAVTVQVSAIDTAGRESALTQPVVVTPAADATSAILITEIMPDTWNAEPLEARDVYDAYEFIELYNPRSQPIDLNGYSIRFTQLTDATKSWTWSFNAPTVVEPNQTIAVWVRPNGLGYLEKDGFNYFYNGFQEAKYIPESSIVMADGAGGLNNGGGTIEVIASDGSVLAAAAYAPGQFAEKQGIAYSYPMFGGVDMRILGTLRTGTPGTVETMQVPQPNATDRISPAAPAGFKATPGAGQVTVSWQPNAEADLAGYRLFVNGQFELRLPAAAASYTVPSLPGEKSVKLELSAIDSSGNESARATTTVKPSYAVITQEERKPSPANALTESRYQMAWDTGEKAAVLPGLVQGHVPQGMSYYSDGQREWILMAAYHIAGDPSTLSVVDAKTGLLEKYVHLKNADGTIYTGHAGGVAVSKENIWLSSGKRMHRLPIQALIDAPNGGFATFADSFGVVTNASFAAYEDGMLWVGEYSNPPSYTTNPTHELTNRNGELHRSWIAGYRLDETDRLAAGTPSIQEEGMQKYIPSHIMSIGDKIQGVGFNAGEVLLTYNYGRPYNSILRHSMPNLSDLATRNADAAIGGYTVPVWMLDGVNQTGTIDIPTAAENMFVRNENGADHLYVNFESGANHMRFMSSYSMDRLLKLNLDLVRAYDKRVLSGIPDELTIGAEVQAIVLADRGKSAAKNVTSAYGWASSDPSVVAVSPSGLVRALKPGIATISAKAGESVLTATVHVASPLSIAADLPAEGRMIEGDSFQLAVKGIYPNGSQSNVTRLSAFEVKGSSGAVEVSETGLVRAVKPGAGFITASFEGKSIELKLIVDPSESKGHHGGPKS